MKKIFFLVGICFIMILAATAQNVGIGTITPLARLHVDSTVVFTGTPNFPALTNPPITGAGTRMMWYPVKAAFRSGEVSGTQWDIEGIGYHSFAAGYNTIASGNNSAAIGFTTTASGLHSTALGELTFASGRATSAMGYFTSASGFAATALGYNTTAKAFNSFSTGIYNDDADNPNPNTIELQDRIFQIGNGSFNNRSNALTVLRNGNVGLGTANPTAGFHVSDKAVLFEGASLNNNTFPPASGSGGRMMWFPERAAFRSGYLTGDFANWWNRDSIGKYSFAVGQNVKAKVDFSIAMGAGSQALEYASVAIGLQSIASGIQSISMGTLNVASGNNSIALGRETAATGLTATSMGYKTIASNNDATSMGYQTEASGGATTSMGAGTTAKAYGSTSIGVYNDNLDAPNGGNPQPADRLFQVGNGTFAARSNALTVLRNGNTGVGVIDPAYNLDLSTRMRIRGAPGSTAGLWLNNETNTTIPAFMGMQSDNHVGFYGNSSGWSFVMNTTNGNVGIGTSLPKARLHIADSAVLFTGSTSQPPVTTTIHPPAEGAGTRMMWLPSLGAFRTGYVDGAQWDKNNIGRLSFATGGNNTASGEYAVAMGFLNSASGQGSVSIGRQNTSLGIGSISIGSSNVVGNFAIAVGISNQAGNPGAVALGEATAAVGYGSFTAGIATKAYSYSGTSVGSYNDNSDVPDPENPASTDRIFQIGNGDFLTAKNAMTVLRNGNTGIGVLNPSFVLDVGARMRIRAVAGNSAGVWLNNEANNAQPSFIGMRSDNLVGFYGNGSPNNGWGMLMNTTNGRVGIGTDNPSQALHVIGNILASGTITQNSDARLKKDITPLSHTLQSLQHLNGYTYHWKDPSNPDEQIGLLAQELQKVYPQLVNENEQGTLSVNYNGMVPVLLAAIKEQQKQIDELKKMLLLMNEKIK